MSGGKPREEIQRNRRDRDVCVCMCVYTANPYLSRGSEHRRLIVQRDLKYTNTKHTRVALYCWFGPGCLAVFLIVSSPFFLSLCVYVSVFPSVLLILCVHVKTVRLFPFAPCMCCFQYL